MKVYRDADCDPAPGAEGAHAGGKRPRRSSPGAAMAIAQSGEFGNPWKEDHLPDRCYRTAGHFTVLLSTVQGHTAWPVLHDPALSCGSTGGSTGGLAQGYGPRDAPRRGLSDVRPSPGCRPVLCPGTGERRPRGQERALSPNCSHGLRVGGVAPAQATSQQARPLSQTAAARPVLSAAGRM